MARKRVAILGSTGSIGTQALDVIGHHPDRFEVVGLAAGRNAALLADQVAAVSAHAGDDAPPTDARGLDAGRRREQAGSRLGGDRRIGRVRRGICAPSAAAYRHCRCEQRTDRCRRRAAGRGGEPKRRAILPVDSEHSAIFQCLVGEDRATVAEIVLTASGGPFWRTSAKRWHGPTWRRRSRTRPGAWERKTPSIRRR